MFSGWSEWLSNPVMWPFAAFHVWMLVDAARREEWVWFAFMFIFPVINDVLYFFLVFRAERSSVSTGFELPGQHRRERIAELFLCGWNRAELELCAPHVVEVEKATDLRGRGRSSLRLLEMPKPLHEMGVSCDTDCCSFHALFSGEKVWKHALTRVLPDLLPATRYIL